MTISKVEGTFSDFDGTMQISTEDFTRSEVYFKVKTASVNTGIEMRDNDLRSPNFFNSKKYPYMEFKSTRIERSNTNGHYTMYGNLTIRNSTHPIALDVHYQSIAKESDGSIRLGFVVRSDLNRFDYGLTWNKLADFGGLIVGKDVHIVCNLQMIRN